jgi:hypothetical protein
MEEGRTGDNQKAEPDPAKPPVFGFAVGEDGDPPYEEGDGEKEGGTAEDLPEDIGEIGTDYSPQVVDLGCDGLIEVEGRILRVKGVEAQYEEASRSDSEEAADLPEQFLFGHGGPLTSR